MTKHFRYWSDLIDYVDENVIEELESLTRETGLLEHYGTPSYRNPDGLLGRAVHWIKTPQGHWYWAGISAQLREKRLRDPCPRP